MKQWIQIQFILETDQEEQLYCYLDFNPVK